MLRELRKTTTGILVKLILLLLILAFGLWGIGDVFRAASVNNAVATMDGDVITLPELERTIARLQAQIPELTAEVAQSFPVRMDTLNRLINTRLIYLHMQDLGLELSADTLAEAIAKDPNFANEDGEFDALRFEAILKNNKLSEQRFLEQYGSDVQLAIIDDSIRKAVRVPDVMKQVYYDVYAEGREASLVLLGQSAVEQDVAAASDEALSKMYEQEKDRFYVPERREFRFISFDATDLHDLMDVQVSDEELMVRYDEQKEIYRQVEMREVQQYNFSDEEAANKGLEALRAGNAPHEPVALGMLSFAELPESVAGNVFDLQEGAYSAPLKSEFGWQVYAVSTIEPSHILPFEEVRSEIETAALAEVMNDQVNALAEQLDEQIAAGATLPEAMKATKIDALDISTLSTARQSGAEGLEAEIIASGFEMEEGEVSSVMLSDDHQYFVVQVKQVTPGYEKPFAEVKQELKKLHREQQIREMLREKAQTLAAELGEAEDVIGAIQETGYDTVISGRLHRDDEQIGELQVTGGLMTEIFRLPKYGATDAYPLPNGEYAVAVVTRISPAPENAQAMQQLGTTIELAQQNAMFESYINALRVEYNVQVNTEVMMSGTQQATP